MRICSKLRLTGVFTPTLASDFRRLTGRDVQWGGIVRGTYFLNPTLTLRSAVGYQQTFYGPLYVVQAGLDWQASEKVRIFGDLPGNLTARYAAASKLNVGFELLANAGSYRLAREDRYVRYRSGVAGLFAEYYVTPKIALRATGGYSIVRNLEIYAKDDRVDGIVNLFNIGTEPTPLSPTIDKGMVLRVAASYRLPTR